MWMFQICISILHAYSWATSLLVLVFFFFLHSSVFAVLFLWWDLGVGRAVPQLILQPNRWTGGVAGASRSCKKKTCLQKLDPSVFFLKNGLIIQLYVAFSFMANLGSCSSPTLVKWQKVQLTSFNHHCMQWKNSRSTTYKVLCRMQTTENHNCCQDYLCKVRTTNHLNRERNIMPKYLGCKANLIQHT